MPSLRKPFSRRRSLGAVLLIGCGLSASSGVISPQGFPLYGFSERGANAQRTLERRFIQLPTAARITAAHRVLTAEPHVAGTPRDRELADWVRDRWKEDGPSARCRLW